MSRIPHAGALAEPADVVLEVRDADHVLVDLGLGGMEAERRGVEAALGLEGVVRDVRPDARPAPPLPLPLGLQRPVAHLAPQVQRRQEPVQVALVEAQALDVRRLQLRVPVQRALRRLGLGDRRPLAPEHGLDLGAAAGVQLGDYACCGVD